MASGAVIPQVTVSAPTACEYCEGTTTKQEQTSIDILAAAAVGGDTSPKENRPHDPEISGNAKISIEARSQGTTESMADKKLAPVFMGSLPESSGNAKISIEARSQGTAKSMADKKLAPVFMGSLPESSGNAKISIEARPQGTAESMADKKLAQAFMGSLPSIETSSCPFHANGFSLLPSSPPPAYDAEFIFPEPPNLRTCCSAFPALPTNTDSLSVPYSVADPCPRKRDILSHLAPRALPQLLGHSSPLSHTELPDTPPRDVNPCTPEVCKSEQANCTGHRTITNCGPVARHKLEIETIDYPSSSVSVEHINMSDEKPIVFPLPDGPPSFLRRSCHDRFFNKFCALLLVIVFAGVVAMVVVPYIITKDGP
uniref:uncharacterized protein n=1 Tax=Myxine glutinosa TaxID=7769 RepID=UPI00358F1D13